MTRILEKYIIGGKMYSAEWNEDRQEYIVRMHEEKEIGAIDGNLSREAVEAIADLAGPTGRNQHETACVDALVGKNTRILLDKTLELLEPRRNPIEVGYSGEAI